MYDMLHALAKESQYLVQKCLLVPHEITNSIISAIQNLTNLYRFFVQQLSNKHLSLQIFGIYDQRYTNRYFKGRETDIKSNLK